MKDSPLLPRQCQPATLQRQPLSTSLVVPDTHSVSPDQVLLEQWLDLSVSSVLQGFTVWRRRAKVFFSPAHPECPALHPHQTLTPLIYLDSSLHCVYYDCVTTVYSSANTSNDSSSFPARLCVSPWCMVVSVAVVHLLRLQCSVPSALQSPSCGSGTIIYPIDFVLLAPFLLCLLTSCKISFRISSYHLSRIFFHHHSGDLSLLQ